MEDGESSSSKIYPIATKVYGIRSRKQLSFLSS
jgi:hypothetical protein